MPITEIQVGLTDSSLSMSSGPSNSAQKNREFSRKFLNRLMTMQPDTNATESPEDAKKRGRPPSGQALSASARQTRRVEKLDAEGKALLPAVVVSKEVRMALTKFIQFKEMTLGEAVDRIVRDRLLRKRSGKRKKRTNAESIASTALQMTQTKINSIELR